VQLDAVLGNVRALAAGGLLTPQRAPLAFLTLQRNRTWWAASPLLASGQRVGFSDSQLVWQFYPGQGIQVQWLGSFGKANGLLAARNRNAELSELLDEAQALAVPRAGGIAWESMFRFDGGRPPWVSGLTQGTALQAFSRAAVRLGRPELFDVARSALGVFRQPPPEGVRVATAAGAHYAQYSFGPGLRILNGFVQALNGLHDFGALANDDEGRALFAAGEAELRVELPAYDTGAWSLYSPAHESSLNYHVLVRDFLHGLCTRLRDDAQRRPAPTPDPTLYCQADERFSAYLRQPPALALRSRRLRAKDPAALRFTLSKVSTVTLTLVRAGQVVLARTVRFEHGTRSFAVRLRHSGPLQVRLRAVDPAGNAAQIEGQVEVLRPRRHRR
jgi:hypothetical protein